VRNDSESRRWVLDARGQQLANGNALDIKTKVAGVLPTLAGPGWPQQAVMQSWLNRTINPQLGYGQCGGIGLGSYAPGGVSALRDSIANGTYANIALGPTSTDFRTTGQDRQIGPAPGIYGSGTFGPTSIGGNTFGRATIAASIASPASANMDWSKVCNSELTNDQR
jgi:hypothetical protein